MKCLTKLSPFPKNATTVGHILISGNCDRVEYILDWKMEDDELVLRPQM